MRRWIELAAFAFAALVTQLVWLDFAPILVEVEKRFSVDESTASWLILPFPLLYVLLSLPAGRAIDKRGVRAVVGLGAIVTAVGALVRLDVDHFASLVVGQVIASVAQPFVVNGITKLVAERFSEKESANANGLGTVGMFVGMAAGLASTPPLVDAFDLRGAMIAHAAIAVVAAVVWFGTVRSTMTTQNVDSASTSMSSSWIALVKNRRLLLLAAIAFAGLGYFNGLTTWLEQLLAPRGVDANLAGVVGGALIGGGIVGAIVVPLLADKLHRRRLPLLACAVVTALLHALLASSSSGFVAIAVLLGFAFLPAFALLLTMTAEVVGPSDTAAATALVLLAGNAGGVVVVAAMGAYAEWSRGCWVALGAIAVVAALLALLAPETAKSSVA